MGLTIALIGCGRWGKNHARVLKTLQNQGLIDEVVLCDVNKEAVKKISAKYKIDKYYYDVNDLINHEKIDGAIIAVPTVFHYKVAKQLLPKADLLIEKPITATLEEAEDLIKKANNFGRLIMVGHIERFNQGVISLKEEVEKLLNKGDKIVYISAQRIGPGPAKGKSLNLGVAHDLLVHDVDIVIYLLKCMPKSVFAIAKYSKDFEYEVEINALYKFDNDIETIASLRASYRTAPTFKKRILMIQTLNCSITLDYILQSYTIERGVMEHRLSGDFMELITAYYAEDVEVKRLLFRRENEPLLLEDKHFIEVIEGKTKPIVTAEDGYKALKCVLLALKSSKEEKEVKI